MATALRTLKEAQVQLESQRDSKEGDLQRQLADCKAELDRRQREHARALQQQTVSHEEAMQLARVQLASAQHTTEELSALKGSAEGAYSLLKGLPCKMCMSHSLHVVL